MKRSAYFLPLVAGLFALAGCESVESPGTEGIGAVHDGELRTFRTQADAVAYAKSRMAQGDKAVTLRLAGAGADTAKSMAEALKDDTRVASIKTRVMAGIVLIEPEYAEDTLILRAYKDPAFEAQLTARQKKALAKARQVVAQARRSGSDYECALALHDYIVKNATYTRNEASRSLTCCTSAVLLDGTGVCEGYTRAYNLLLTMAGIECRYVGGRDRQGPHCWTLVKLGGQWVHVDCTYDDPMPDSAGRAMRSFFGMSDSQIAASRSWSRGSLPSASSSSLYHPFKTGMRFSTMQQFVEYCAAHDMPNEYVTVYIDELGRPGVKLEELLRMAHARFGRQAVFSILEIQANPCAIGVQCVK